MEMRLKTKWQTAPKCSITKKVYFYLMRVKLVYVFEKLPGFKMTWDCDVSGGFSDKAWVICAAPSSFMLRKRFQGEEWRGDLVYYTNSTLGEHRVPGPLPMQLDKSKEWTGGVGMVLEWYYETMPSGHVASPALRMEREESECPQWPRLWVTGTATSCQSGSEWVGLWVRARPEHLKIVLAAADSLSA